MPDLNRYLRKKEQSQGLPGDLGNFTLPMVFDYLNAADLTRASLVCKAWQEVASDKDRWRDLFLRQHLHQSRREPDKSLITQSDWKKFKYAILNCPNVKTTLTAKKNRAAETKDQSSLSDFVNLLSQPLLTSAFAMLSYRLSPVVTKGFAYALVAAMITETFSKANADSNRWYTPVLLAASLYAGLPLGAKLSALFGWFEPYLRQTLLIIPIFAFWHSVREFRAACSAATRAERKKTNAQVAFTSALAPNRFPASKEEEERMRSLAAPMDR